MAPQRSSVIALSLLVLIEYTLGGLVTFSDPSDAGFQLSSFTASWPAILPAIHRLFAVVLIVLWIVLSRPLRGSRAFAISHATLGMIFLQAIVGIFIPLTQSSSFNDYIVIVHFALSGLIIAATGLMAFIGWSSVKSPERPTAQKQPEGS